MEVEVMGWAKIREEEIGRGDWLDWAEGKSERKEERKEKGKKEEKKKRGRKRENLERN